MLQPIGLRGTRRASTKPTIANGGIITKPSAPVNVNSCANPASGSPNPSSPNARVTRGPASRE
jgi:hypothetical protein